MGYLPLALSQAKLYFKGYLNPSAKGQDESGGADREPWLDYKGTPVKWHIPTGTLYDLMCRYVQLCLQWQICPPGPSTASLAGIPVHGAVHFFLLNRVRMIVAISDVECRISAWGRDDELPWCLTIHFSGYPEKALLPYSGETTLHCHFKQTAKQVQESTRFFAFPLHCPLSCRHLDCQAGLHRP